MPTYRDEGIVLRTHDLGEADRIITLLTRGHGKVRAVARGVRKEKSRFGSRVEPFMRSDLLIATGRSLDVISQASLITPYARGIAPRYPAYVAASVVAETADKLHADPQPQGAWRRPERVADTGGDAEYRLLAGALACLASGRHDPTDVAHSYLLRAMALGGWVPVLDGCLVCSRPDPVCFSVSAGGLLCREHRVADARTVTPGQIAALRALLSGDWRALDGPRGEDGRGAAAAGPAGAAPLPAPPGDAVVGLLVGEWGEYYMERPVRSLRLLHSMA